VLVRLVCVGAPLLAGIVGLVVALAISGDLPDRVAVHVDTGEPRGYTGRGNAIALVAIGPALGLIAAAIGLLVARGRSGWQRLAAAASTGIAVLLTFLVVGMLWEQRGLYDPRQSPGLDGVILPALVLSAVLAVAAGALASTSRR
jgi:hypothetical protein